MENSDNNLWEDMNREIIVYFVFDPIYDIEADNVSISKELSSLGFYLSELRILPSGKIIAVWKWV